MQPEASGRDEGTRRPLHPSRPMKRCFIGVISLRERSPILAARQELTWAPWGAISRTSALDEGEGQPFRWRARCICFEELELEAGIEKLGGSAEHTFATDN